MYDSSWKLIQIYLRNNMCNDRLKNLALISIEGHTLSDVTQADIVSRFAAMHTRKVQQRFFSEPMWVCDRTKNTKNTQTIFNAAKVRLKP